MGYRTDYKLKVDNTLGIPLVTQKEYILEQLAQLDEYWDFDNYDPITDCLEFSLNETSWYDHEEDMKVLSKNVPDVLFELYGEGQESGDLWYKYFKNGKMQYCPGKVVFDDYDESKLV